jgi:hypothetical protein
MTIDALERQIADLIRLVKKQQASLDTISNALIKAGLMPTPTVRLTRKPDPEPRYVKVLLKPKPAPEPEYVQVQILNSTPDS